MKSKYVPVSLLILIFAASCSNNNNKSDAYGNFEAVEILIGSEVQGKIVSFNIEEGQEIKKGQVAGYIDSLSLFLKKQQLTTQMEGAKVRLVQVQSQIAVQEEQKKSLLREQQRLTKLVSANAAPVKQLDDINSQLDILNSQIISTRVQNQLILYDVKALQYQVAQTEDQLNKSVIRNPENGTVLEKYVEPGEIAVPGKILYKIADISTLRLRVYVSGAQLPHIKIGQKAKVYIDENARKNRQIEGTVSWISQQAEFTPKIIQTKDERVNLVYAIKLDVVNDGSLKIGMPGEVKF